MKNFTRKLTLLLMGLSFVFAAEAQKVSGIVKDSAGSPIIGASVVVEGTTVGTSTGISGEWNLDVPNAPQKKLVFSYLGMKDQTVAIGNRTYFEIVLEGDAEVMEDVVVVGYATVQRKDLIGSVSSVSSETLASQPVTSVSEALSGKMAGVQVTTTEGDPDADIKIRVRGGGSITQDSSPLYIVDGFPVESINDIPSSDIQSIDVLKDAFSTAIYGSRGANGVIIVTTKSGKEGRLSVNYNGYIGVKAIANKDALVTLDTEEFVKLQYELAMLRDQVEGNYEPYFGQFCDIDLYAGQPKNDYVAQVFGNQGSTSNHNISLSGGSDSFNWTASYSHMGDNAIMKGSTYTRDNLNLKTKFKPNKKVSFDFSVRFSDTNVRGSGANSINDSGSTSGNGRLKHAIGYSAFKALGYSMNTDNMSEIEAAYNWLLEMNNTMEPTYVTDEVIDGMIGGIKDIAVVYSGDASIILQENENMSFHMPNCGTNIWYDCMVIPANAENPKLAHEFINYMLSYEAAYDNAETVGYTSPNAEVVDIMVTSDDLFAGNAAYLPRSGFELDESFVDNQTLKKTLSEMWIKVKAN